MSTDDLFPPTTVDSLSPAASAPCFRRLLRLVRRFRGSSPRGGGGCAIPNAPMLCRAGFFFDPVLLPRSFVLVAPMPAPTLPTLTLALSSIARRSDERTVDVPLMHDSIALQIV